MLSYSLMSDDELVRFVKPKFLAQVDGLRERAQYLQTGARNNVMCLPPVHS
jgi:hypothetical protein